MPRFAILTHDHPFLHWDLLLEEADGCRTWRLLEPPAAGRVVAAQPLPPHRKLYLDYEGPVGGERGRVTRWDRGSFAMIEDAATRVVVRLRGERLAGTLTLAATPEAELLRASGEQGNAPTHRSPASSPGVFAASAARGADASPDAAHWTAYLAEDPTGSAD